MVPSDIITNKYYMQLFSWKYYIIMSPELETFGGYPEDTGEEPVLWEQIWNG
jgi:hypothetical protein